MKQSGIKPKEAKKQGKASKSKDCMLLAKIKCQ